MRFKGERPPDPVRVAAASAALLLLAATPLRSDTSLRYWYESLMRNGGGAHAAAPPIAMLWTIEQGRTATRRSWTGDGSKCRTTSSYAGMTTPLAAQCYASTTCSAHSSALCLAHRCRWAIPARRHGAAQKSNAEKICRCSVTRSSRICIGRIGSLGGRRRCSMAARFSLARRGKNSRAAEGLRPARAGGAWHFGRPDLSGGLAERARLPLDCKGITSREPHFEQRHRFHRLETSVQCSCSHPLRRRTYCRRQAVAPR